MSDCCTSITAGLMSEYADVLIFHGVAMPMLGRNGIAAPDACRSDLVFLRPNFGQTASGPIPAVASVAE